VQFRTALRIKVQGCEDVTSQHECNSFKKKKTSNLLVFLYLAERTGLEPATPGVTGRYSNQLNYHSETTKICVT
jgi:hypothetical protein